MELVVTGWSRDHGEKVIARRDLTEARFSTFRGYKRPEVYLTTTEGRETGPLGVHVVPNGNIDLRFYAKITLNGEYLTRLRMNRKEAARLFLSAYEDCSLQELLEVIEGVRNTRADRDFSPVLLKRVKEIGLSDQTVAWLASNNIFHVGDLVQKAEPELQNLAKYDDATFFEIWEQLSPLGLHLGMTIPDWPTVPKIMLTRLDDFGLSVRTANCLKNDSIEYLGQLVQKTEEELLRRPNFGQKSLAEIKEVILAPHDLRLGMNLPNWRDPN
jgi:DNA-directed RNA polymerase alpha subunit